MTIASCAGWWIEKPLRESRSVVIGRDFLIKRWSGTKSRIIAAWLQSITNLLYFRFSSLVIRRHVYLKVRRLRETNRKGLVGDNSTDPLAVSATASADEVSWLPCIQLVIPRHTSMTSSRIVDHRAELTMMAVHHLVTMRFLVRTNCLVVGSILEWIAYFAVKRVCERFVCYPKWPTDTPCFSWIFKWPGFRYSNVILPSIRWRCLVLCRMRFVDELKFSTFSKIKSFEYFTGFIFFVFVVAWLLQSFLVFDFDNKSCMGIGIVTL